MKLAKLAHVDIHSARSQHVQPILRQCACLVEANDIHLSTHVHSCWRDAEHTQLAQSRYGKGCAYAHRSRQCWRYNNCHQVEYANGKGAPGNADLDKIGSVEAETHEGNRRKKPNKSK